MISFSTVYFCIATVSGFNITELNTTSVRVTWVPITTTGVIHYYNVYYMSSDGRKRQTDIGSVTFPGNTSEGVIGGLDPNLDYTFAISVTFDINGVMHEGERSYFIASSMK